MHFQNLFAALEVGQLHRHTAVKTSGTGQRRVQRIRAVGSRQNDDAGVALKAVHLGEQLVQSLLTLVVAAEIAAVALLTDGIDLIDEHDAGGLFLGLSEQSRTLDAPMPTNISTNSEPEMEKKGTLDSPATALASMVLPVPGGPTSRMPLGMDAPMLSYLPGSCR